MTAGPGAPARMQVRADDYLPIAGYGLVGDCRSVALVGVDGSVDWCCLPRFDSPSLFARIPDPGGGCWQLVPAVPHRSWQRYAEEINILQTIFETGRGRAELARNDMAGEAGRIARPLTGQADEPTNYPRGPRGPAEAGRLTAVGRLYQLLEAAE